MELPVFSLWDVLVSSLQIFNPVFGYIADSDLLFKGSKRKTLIVLSVLGIGWYVLCALHPALNGKLYHYLILHFVVELFGSFRMVIVDSFAAELNNLEKAMNRTKGYVSATENLNVTGHVKSFQNSRVSGWYNTKRG